MSAQTAPAKTPVANLPGVFDSVGGRISVVKLPAGCFDSKISGNDAVAAINLDGGALWDSDRYYKAQFNISADLSAQAPLKASLGTANKNTFVSVQSERDTTTPGNRYSFYLITNTQHDAPAAAFKKWLSEQPAQFSIGAAIASPEYARVQAAADVNHRAVVARVLQTLNLSNAVPVRPDNVYQYSNPSVVPRDLAKKSALKNMAAYGGASLNGDTAVLYRNSLDMSSFKGDAVAVPLGFTDGTRLFKLPAQTPTVRNRYNNSLPLASQQSSTVTQALTKDDIATLNSVVYWQGKRNMAHESELSLHVSSTITPEYLSDESKRSDYGLASAVGAKLETVALIPGGFGV